MSDHVVGSQRYFAFLILLLGQLCFPEKINGQQPVRPALGQTLVKLFIADDVRVRAKKIPRAFNERGEPRRLTPNELKDLRGNDPKVPGYAAEYSDLKPGQLVVIYLARKKLGKDAVKSKDAQIDAVNEETWVPAGQLSGRLAIVEGPEFAKAPKIPPKGKAAGKAREILRQLTLRANPYLPGNPPLKLSPVEASDDVVVTMVLIVDDRTTK